MDDIAADHPLNTATTPEGLLAALPRVGAWFNVAIATRVITAKNKPFLTRKALQLALHGDTQSARMPQVTKKAKELVAGESFGPKPSPGRDPTGRWSNYILATTLLRPFLHEFAHDPHNYLRHFGVIWKAASTSSKAILAVDAKKYSKHSPPNVDNPLSVEAHDVMQCLLTDMCKQSNITPIPQFSLPGCSILATNE